MRIPILSEIFSGVVHWPVFLLAYKVYYFYFTFSDFALLLFFTCKRVFLFILVFNSFEHCKRFCGEGCVSFQKD